MAEGLPKAPVSIPLILTLKIGKLRSFDEAFAIDGDQDSF